MPYLAWGGGHGKIPSVTPPPGPGSSRDHGAGGGDGGTARLARDPAYEPAEPSIRAAMIGCDANVSQPRPADLVPIRGTLRRRALLSQDTF